MMGIIKILVFVLREKILISLSAKYKLFLSSIDSLLTNKN